MEDVLEAYTRPSDPARLQVCLDEIVEVDRPVARRVVLGAAADPQGLLQPLGLR
jgi:hypothetical protein